MLPAGQSIDVFRGKTAKEEDEDETFPTQLSRTVKVWYSIVLAIYELNNIELYFIYFGGFK